MNTDLKGAMDQLLMYQATFSPMDTQGSRPNSFVSVTSSTSEPAEVHEEPSSQMTVSMEDASGTYLCPRGLSLKLEECI